jgi:putative redox protein
MAGVEVTLSWQGEGQHFHGGKAGGPQVTIDGDGKQGPSPMTALALALAGCMAVDVLDITQKMRLPVSALDVRVVGERRDEPPRRYTALLLKYRVGGVGAADEEKVWRAIELSREKYCSVWHSLREDIALNVELELA